jgi:hypothetical protein
MVRGFTRRAITDRDIIAQHAGVRAARAAFVARFETRCSSTPRAARPHLAARRTMPCACVRGHTELPGRARSCGPRA